MFSCSEMSHQPIPTDTSKTLNELQSELSTIKRVSHRLALTDAGPALEKVLHLLLPRLLMRLGKNEDSIMQTRCNINKRKISSDSTDFTENDTEIHDRVAEIYDLIKNQLIEVLGHIMKRVREDKECKLPCITILESMLPEKVKIDTTDGFDDESNTNALKTNLSLSFLTLGINRCNVADCTMLLPGLLKLLESILDGTDKKVKSIKNSTASTVDIGFLMDPNRKMRYDQIWHLILRCLERISQSLLETTSTSGINNSHSHLSIDSKPSLSCTTLQDCSLLETKQVLASSCLLGAALFDNLADIALYSPIIDNSTLISNGLSTVGYMRLLNGAASERSGCTNWREEFMSRANLKALKLGLLNLIAPCRKVALFLPEKLSSIKRNDPDKNFYGEDNEVSPNETERLGLSRTVALLLLFCGDSDLDVKDKAELYLRAHMDSYRGKEVPTVAVDPINDNNKTRLVLDVLLGNSVTLVNSILTFALGDVSSLKIVEKVLSSYSNTTLARTTVLQRLGVTYSIDDDNEAHKRAMLSSCRMKLSDLTVTSVLNFTSKILQDNPKIFIQGVVMENDESDIAAVFVGSLILASFSNSSKPGSSGSSVLESAASLLNTLCLRLTHFLETRAKFCSLVSASSERLLSLLSRSMMHACAALTPTASGESSFMKYNKSKTEATDINIRDQLYGVICTLARSKTFSINEKFALFDCGNSVSFTETKSSESSIYSLTSISTATLLFGCASNEIEILRPRAAAALDALLAAFVRVLKLHPTKTRETSDQSSVHDIENPWNETSFSEQKLGEKGKVNITQTNSICTLSRLLLPLLWNASRRSQPKSSRLAAVQWSHEILLRLDRVHAYNLLCFLCGDDDATVTIIAKKALGIENTLGEEINLNDNDDDSVSFNTLMDAIVGSEAKNSRPKYDEFHERGKAASLRFILQKLLSESSVYIDGYEILALEKYVMIMVKTLASFVGRSLSKDEVHLADECSICLSGCTSSSNIARRIVIANSNEKPTFGVKFGFEKIVQLALTSQSSKVRINLAAVMRSLYEDKSVWKDADTMSTTKLSASHWLEVTGLVKTAELCFDKLRTMLEASCLLGEVHGAAYLGSSCVRAFRLALLNVQEQELSDIGDPLVTRCWSNCSGIVSLLGKGLSHSEMAIGNACSQGLVIAFSYDGHDAPILSEELFDSMAIALQGVGSSLKKFSSIDHADPTRACSLIHASGILLAASTSGAGYRHADLDPRTAEKHIDLGPMRLHCVESLFGVLGSAVYKKDEELSLTVGEALVKYADALGSGKWSSTSDQGEWTNQVYEDVFAFSLPPQKHVLYTLFQREFVSSNPIKRIACASTLLALVGHASRLVNISTLFRTRAMIEEVYNHLDLFQSTFIKLLSDPKCKQLSRESACKGLVACRGLSFAMLALPEEALHEHKKNFSNMLNERLLKAFGQTSNYGSSAMIETEAEARERRNEGSVSEDAQETEIGGAPGLGEAALGAYREIASAAVSMGRPDVLYTLIMHSTNHPIWNMPDIKDRYSAPSLLGKVEGLNIKEIRVALRPHLGKLIPRLLRAQNDPNKQTREQMDVLWIVLTGGGSEARELINQNLLSTLDSLMEDAVSKFWRARVGACGALSELIVGRSWDDLGGGDVEEEQEVRNTGASIRLWRLWRITMRALDDVRAAVRERGESMGRAMRALTIRLCDQTRFDRLSSDEELIKNIQQERSEKQHKSNTENAARASLSWILKNGLNQPCAEAIVISLSTLLGIVDIAKPSTLQPVLDSLISSLLMAMSGLEPAALNYLQVRSAGNDGVHENGENSYDRLERMRVQLAMSGPIFAALNKCLDMVKFIDLDSQKKIVSQLDTSLRKGVGFATRASTAGAVTTLCNTCPNAFKFPGTSPTNPTVRLLRSLYFASERERGASSKDKMIHALGSLSQLAPGKAVRSLGIKACERYFESSGSNNDPAVRRAAAATIRTIVVRASSQLLDGGPRDIWIKIVLPTAFLGRHDNDSKVSSLWKDVWEDGGVTIGSIVSHEAKLGALLQEQLLPYIVEAILLALRSTSWANRRAACAALTELTDANILAPVPYTSNSYEISNESRQRFRQRAQASCVLLSECVKLIARSRIWMGKADVVKAATIIAVKWIDVSPTYGTLTELFVEDPEFIPMVLQNKYKDDLFVGDLWFLRNSDETLECGDEENEGLVDENEIGDEKDDCESNLVLDFSDEKEFVEEEQIIVNNAIVKKQSQPVLFSGFCRLLCDQGLRMYSNESTEGILPYKAAALTGLASLLQSSTKSKNANKSVDVFDHHRMVYNLLAPRLYSYLTEVQYTSKKTPPPLLLAKSLECLASAFYDGVGNIQSADYANPLVLLRFFSDATGITQPAWTVRQSAALAASTLVAKMPSEILMRNEVISTALNCASQTLKDRKFWKVRHAGLELLLSLVGRVGIQGVGDPNNDSQVLLEAILPYKERIIVLARQNLADSESQVTAAASRITLAMAWWP